MEISSLNFRMKFGLLIYYSGRYIVRYNPALGAQWTKALIRAPGLCALMHDTGCGLITIQTWNYFGIDCYSTLAETKRVTLTPWSKGRLLRVSG